MGCGDDRYRPPHLTHRKLWRNFDDRWLTLSILKANAFSCDIFLLVRHQVIETDDNSMTLISGLGV